jgi:hypothetical protein
MGWGMDIAVLLFENDEESHVGQLLSDTVFKTDNSDRPLIVRMADTFFNAEDLLSTLDFKKHILLTREGITVPNSVYIKDKELSRNFILSKFLSDVKAGKVRVTDFDDETVENFNMVIDLFNHLK